MEALVADRKRIHLTPGWPCIKTKDWKSSQKLKRRNRKRVKKAQLKVARVEKKENASGLIPFYYQHLTAGSFQRLNFYAKRTMRVAQELYEGLSLGKDGTVGLITYLRTDSTRIASVAQDEALDFIKSFMARNMLQKVPMNTRAGKASGCS